MKNAALRAKLHEVGKRCLAHAKARTVLVEADPVADLLVELHSCIELVLTELEDVDDELEARMVVCLARLRARGEL